MKNRNCIVEVVFGASAEGCLKAARCTDPKTQQNVLMRAQKDGCIEVPAFPEEKYEVLTLDFCWNIGTLQEDITSDYRMKLPAEQYLLNYVRFHPEEKEILYANGERNIQNLNALQKWANYHVPVRIWYSMDPGELCGLYHVCSVLEGIDTEISVVMLPQTLNAYGKSKQLNSCGSLNPHEMAYLQKYSRVLDKEEIHYYVSLWNELVEENTPLRTVIAGSVISVAEDFFDEFIYAQIPKESEFLESEWVGNVMMYGIGLGDGWISQRIRKFIEQKRVTLIQDSESMSKRIIKA